MNKMYKTLLDVLVSSAMAEIEELNKGMWEGYIPISSKGVPSLSPETIRNNTPSLPLDEYAENDSNDSVENYTMTASHGLKNKVSETFNTMLTDLYDSDNEYDWLTKLPDLYGAFMTVAPSIEDEAWRNIVAKEYERILNTIPDIVHKVSRDVMAVRLHKFTAINVHRLMTSIKKYMGNHNVAYATCTQYGVFHTQDVLLIERVGNKYEISLSDTSGNILVIEEDSNGEYDIVEVDEERVGHPYHVVRSLLKHFDWD